MNVQISENIKKLRISNNMSQNDLAKVVHLNKASISAYENAVVMPSYDTLIKLAAFFKVSTDSLLGYTDKYDNAIAKLTLEQKNTIFELIEFYEYKNNQDNN